MRNLRSFMALAIFFSGSLAFAQDDSSMATPTEVMHRKTTQHDLDMEMMNLELQKCQLDNEKLQLEIDRLRLQKGFGPEAASTPVSQPPKRDEDNKNGSTINLEASTRAEELSKENSANPKIIIFDTQNAELWIEGTRYPVYELFHVMKDKDWPYKRDLVTTKSDGTRRFKYSYQNISLEKYENEKFGVFTIEKPKDDQDFQVLTIEGVGLDVSENEVRNRFQNEYFRYDNEERNDKIYYLRYKHTHGFLGWDDKLVFGFDVKTHNLVEIKYGVLDEN